MIASLSRVQDKVAAFAAFFALTLALAVPSLRISLRDPQLDAWLAWTASRSFRQEDVPTYVILESPQDYVYFAYAPPEWNCLELTSPQRFHPGQELRIRKLRQTQEPPPHAEWVLMGIPGQMNRFPADPAWDKDGPVMVFWYPDASRLGVSGQAQLDYVKSRGVLHWWRPARTLSKLDVSSNLECIVFPAGNVREYEKAVEAVRGGLEQFGGVAMVFEPTQPPEQWLILGPEESFSW